MGRNSFLHYVHSFRGFAILNIVAIHAFSAAEWYSSGGDFDAREPVYVLSEMLFHDATIYFALISGLLFSATLRHKGYRSFYWSKLTNVVAPYVFCTVVFSVVIHKMDGSGILATQGSLRDYLQSLPRNLILGQAQFTFWYMPVLLALFLMTPLLDRAVNRRSGVSAAFALIALLPLIISRPEFEGVASQVSLPTIVYFAGAYAIGMFSGHRQQETLRFVGQHKAAIALLAIATSAAIVVLQLLGTGRFGGFSAQESLFYIQKLSIAAIVLFWLHGKDAAQPTWLTQFAGTAFSIYFLHAFFIDLVAEWTLPFSVGRQYLPWSLYMMIPVYFATALALSSAAVYVFRMTLAERSRWFLGS